MFKKIIELKLKYLAKLILLKYKPEIVGVTGSVGKTGTKEAIYAVLKFKFNVRTNIKNYNNEIGLPLTILGVESAGKDVFGWLNIFWQGFKLIIKRDKNYPKILVLEMGVDRPGDMKYLTSIAKANVGVITLIGPSHLEFFGSVDEIAKEKACLIKKIKPNGWAVINYDDAKSRDIARDSKEKVLTFGLKAGADVQARELSFSFKENREADNLLGIKYELTYNQTFVPVRLGQVIGLNAVYASLAGAAVGISYGLALEDIARALSNFKSPKGRMNLIPGIKHSLIIDDTYNSSPQSSKQALDIIKKIPIAGAERKFAVLGDMLELGAYTEKGHREVGEYAAMAGINKLIVVGERARDIARGAESAGMKFDNIFHFKNTEETGRFVQARIREHDILLVKGSQGMRMEKIVQEIMAEPLRAKELLVRQDWEKS